ncbi:MAG: hypothetical protein MUF40_00720 [Gemmatimonadaceae bacterium]|nr:hypothetical protein [Gemmatimonadaceae bacterium]
MFAWLRLLAIVALLVVGAFLVQPLLGWRVHVDLCCWRSASVRAWRRWPAW